MSLEFEWDEDKAASNRKKHHVSFEEAASVFADPLALIFDDEALSRGTSRNHYRAFGEESAPTGLFYRAWRSDSDHQCSPSDEEGAS